MLTHSNIVSQINQIPVKFTTEDRFLSLLPVWHIFERTFEMVGIAKGGCNLLHQYPKFKRGLANC